MSESLKRVIDLIKKTGDKMIVTDSEGNNGYVVMSIADYENLIGGGSADLSSMSEDELLDKINDDVSSWRASKTENSSNWYALENIIKEVKQQNKEAKSQDNSLNKAQNNGSEDKYYFEPVE